jgi:glycine/D-amino acid oxidase-like deaminating enzyme
MAKQNVIVIGCGLFGSLAARLADAEGHEVTVIDNAEPWAASKASGCVLAPSWLSSLSSDELATGIDVLKCMATVHDIEFQTNLLKTFKAQRVDPSSILVNPDIVGKVVSVKEGGVVHMEDGTKLTGRVLVAAGIASHELLPQIPRLRGLWGASLMVQGALNAPRIHVYAPYRQAVAFNMSKGKVWMGDGTALITKTWEKERDRRVQDTRDRAAELFQLTGKATPTIGARPYMDDAKKGFFGKVMRNVWASTGGAKNGTMLAALNAHKFVKELK